MGFFSKLFGKSAPSATPPAAPVDVPSDWGWCRVHIRNDRKALGYYYRDRQAGPSVNVLVDLRVATTADAIRSQVAATGDRGSTTVRLGGYEEINVENLPADFIALMRQSYEQCDSPSGTIVLKLSAAERAEYGLPKTPGWAARYV